MEKDGHSCLICQRIAQIETSQNKFFVQAMKTGYVVMGDHQYYRGYTLFLSKDHVSELHELEDRNLFLSEMAVVAEAVYKAFQPRKLNYELLGNSESHLHWHLIPRYDVDPDPQRPIWVVDKKIRNQTLGEKELFELKRKLKIQLSS